ncbi:hypothetical protein [Aliikangiella sp. IMCC44359]|uniref:hypothetical protein n=1 Tax=Aliikangiella sp. IMCC44359 TaxID=3459125 RepID=UPI00403AE524
MNNARTFILTSVVIMTSACNFNPYGPNSGAMERDYCGRITETIDRERCFRKTEEGYKAMHERKRLLDREKKKEEEKTTEELAEKIKKAKEESQ